MPNDLGINETIGILELKDRIYFDFDPGKQISIEDVIMHLQGLEKISKKIPFLLEKLLDADDIKGVKFQYSKLEIEKIEAGSMTDVIKIKLETMLTGEANPELKKKVWKEIEEMHPKMNVALLIGAFVVGAIGMKCCSGNPPAAYSGLQQNFAINIGSTFNIASDKVLPILQETAKKATTDDAKAGLQFIRPAKQAGGKIQLAEGQNVSVDIPKDTIAIMPENYMPQTTTESVDVLTNVDIRIRALDMDHPEKGWYAIIPSVNDKRRLKLELQSSIDPAKLSPLNIKGDVEITYKVQSNGQKNPQKARLLELK